MKKLTRVLLVLFLAILSFPILSQVTSEMETSTIPKSNWTKLTSHTGGADGAAWSPDGSEILYVTWDETSAGTLYKMKADGSNRISLERSEIGNPNVSPDGQKIAVTGSGRIYIMNYDGTDFHAIFDSLDGVNVGRWSPTGDKLAVDERTSATLGMFHILTVDPDGSNPTPLTPSNQSFEYPWWSPDGTKIVCQSHVQTAGPRGMNADIWVMDSDGQNLHRLTQFNDAIFPVWSPDGSIYFYRQPGSPWANSHIYRMNADGTNVVQLTNSSGEWNPAISPDGKWLAFTAYDEHGVRNIYKAELTASMLNLTPDTGFSSATVVGSGFATNSRVTLTWDDIVIPTVPSPLITDSDGSFTAIISIPTQNEHGTHIVEATDKFGNWANAMFTVIDMTGPQGLKGDIGPEGSPGKDAPLGETHELSLLVDAFTIAVSIIAICLATIALLKKKTQVQ